jgi:hypothetical protein
MRFVAFARFPNEMKFPYVISCFLAVMRFLYEILCFLLQKFRMRLPYDISCYFAVVRFPYAISIFSAVAIFSYEP